MCLPRVRWRVELRARRQPEATSSGTFLPGDTILHPSFFEKQPCAEVPPAGSRFPCRAAPALWTGAALLFLAGCGSADPADIAIVVQVQA